MGLNEEFIDLILAELKRAEEEHNWDGYSLDRKCNILSEEAGEVVRAVNRYNMEGKPISEVHGELIQCGAMVLRMLKNLPDNKTA